MALVPGMWAGIGYDVGGEIIVGTQYAKGTVFCLSDPDSSVRFCTFQQESVTVGAGLGGSYGRSFIFGFNIAQPADIDGASSQFDFSLDTGPASESALGKYIRNIPDYLQFWFEFEEGIRRYLFTAGKAIALADKYKTLKQVVANQQALREAASGKPALITVPLPVGGFGMRISLKYKMTTSDVIAWSTRDFSSVRSAAGALRDAYSPI